VIGVVPVFALDLAGIDAMEGFVDKGGEGRPGNCGVLFGVGDDAVEKTGATAIVGDCRGDWIGLDFLESSEKTGGSNGVVACGGSSSRFTGDFAMLISAGLSLSLSSNVVRTGDGR
jgi:hypothetical protein